MRKIVFLLLALPFLISTACEQEIEFNRGIKDATGLEAFTNLTALGALSKSIFITGLLFSKGEFGYWL